MQTDAPNQLKGGQTSQAKNCANPLRLSITNRIWLSRLVGGEGRIGGWTTISCMSKQDFGLYLPRPFAETHTHRHRHTVLASLENGAENEKHEAGAELLSNKDCEGLLLRHLSSCQTQCHSRKKRLTKPGRNTCYCVCVGVECST